MRPEFFENQIDESRGRNNTILFFRPYLNLMIAAFPTVVVSCVSSHLTSTQQVLWVALSTTLLRPHALQNQNNPQNQLLLLERN